MAYEQRPSRRQKLRYNSTNDDNKLIFQLYKDGDKVTPSSATIQISDPDGTEVLAATSLTVSGTLMTKAVATTTTASWPIATGYRCALVVTDGSSVTHDMIEMIDVERYPLRLDLGFDQLVALDDSLRGMRWDGDAEFAALIESTHDILQVLVETKMIEDDRLQSGMILDNKSLSTAAKFLALNQIFFSKGDEVKATKYERIFQTLFDAVISNLRYDKSQEGLESETIGRIRTGRLRT